MRGHRSQAHADHTGSASRQHKSKGLSNIQVPLDLRAQVDVISLPPNKVVRGPSVGSPAKYNTPFAWGNKREPARHVQPCLATGPATNSPGPKPKEDVLCSNGNLYSELPYFFFFRLR